MNNNQNAAMLTIPKNAPKASISKTILRTLTCFFLSSFLVVGISFTYALAEEKADSNSIEESTGADKAQSTTQLTIPKQESTEADKDQMSQSSSENLKDANEFEDIKSSDAFGWRKYFQAVGTMLFLLLVLWYVLKIVRKYGNGRFLPAQKLLPKDSMYIEGQLSLGPNKCITIVKVLDKRLVIGVTEKNITLLTEMVDNEEFNLTKSFQEHMQATTQNTSTPAGDSSPTK